MRSKWRTDIDKEESPMAATQETAGLRRGTEGGIVGMAAAGPEKGRGSALEEEEGGRYVDNQLKCQCSYSLVAWHLMTRRFYMVMLFYDCRVIM